MATCRFAQLSDVHLGHQGEGRWHNRQLFDQAQTLTSAAIDAINAARPDFVILTGDLTHRGTEQSFTVARSVLDRLEPPYYVLPGNHDVIEPGARTIFRSIFAGHVPEDHIYQAWEAGGARFLTLDAWWQKKDGELSEGMPEPAERNGMVIPPEQVAWLEAELQAHPQTPTLIFTHYPLVPIAERFLAYNPKDAGHMNNGEQILDILKANAQVLAVFCGHHHYNQIDRIERDGSELLHCMLCASVEYPMMWREITLDNDSITMTTHLSPVGELRDQSLDGNAWVIGTDADRIVQA